MGTRARSFEALALVVLLWVSTRAAYLAWPDAKAMRAPVTAKIIRRTAGPSLAVNLPHRPSVPRRTALSGAHGQRAGRISDMAGTTGAEKRRDRPFSTLASGLVVTPANRDRLEDAPGSVKAIPAPVASKMRKAGVRPAASVWLLWRPEGNGLALGTAGQLGGSQAGGRIRVPVQPESTLGLSLRLNTSFGSTRSREIAPGISWKPVKAAPFEVIVERRVRAGSSARDATVLFVAGGVSARPLALGWTLDGYAQGGVAGFRDRLWFADGTASVRRPVSDHMRVGAGIWAGAQPGLSRVDIGPSLSTRLAADDLAIRLDLDWRIRVAGGVRPDSGVAITIAKDF